MPDDEPDTGDRDTDDHDADDHDAPEHDYADKSDTDVFVDRDKIDFDPDDGLLSGTAIEGGTDIPGPHESVDDVMPEDDDGPEDDADHTDTDTDDAEDA